VAFSRGAERAVRVSGETRGRTLITTSLARDTNTPSPYQPALDALSPEQVLQTVLATLDDAKAEDTVSIDLHGKTAIGDYMVVTSGRSHRHVGAIADRVIKALKDKGIGNANIEGLPHCDWVLIDAGDVIVHVFRPEVRSFYNLEKMWSSDRPSERLPV
jgi:ribosome-associated protein